MEFLTQSIVMPALVAVAFGVLHGLRDDRPMLGDDRHNPYWLAVQPAYTGDD